MLRVRSSGLQRLAAQLLYHAEASQAAALRLPVHVDAQQSAEQPSTSAAASQQHWSLQRRHFASPAAFKAAISNAHPQSLARTVDTGELPNDESIGKVKHFLLKLGGFYSRESALSRGSRSLYRIIVAQAEDLQLKEALGLPDRFAATYSLLCLHVWLLLVRLRREGDDGRELAQILYEGFQDDVELRVHAEGVKVRVNKWLKELERMFYGSCESYEKALKGQEDMADVLLRNVYGDNSAKRQSAATLAQYIRRELACLEMTPSQEVMSGSIMFSRLHADRPIDPADPAAVRTPA